MVYFNIVALNRLFLRAPYSNYQMYRHCVHPENEVKLGTDLCKKLLNLSRQFTNRYIYLKWFCGSLQIYMQHNYTFSFHENFSAISTLFNYSQVILWMKSFWSWTQWQVLLNSNPGWYCKVPTIRNLYLIGRHLSNTNRGAYVCKFRHVFTFKRYTKQNAK